MRSCKDDGMKLHAVVMVMVVYSNAYHLDLLMILIRRSHDLSSG